MASLTPSPQSSPSVVPPATNSNSSPRPFSISTPPPLPSSTSAPSPKSSPPLRSPATPSPMSQPNVNPPETSNSTNSPPPQSPPPAATSSLPPAPTAFPPQQLTVGSQPPSSRTSPPPNGQPPQNSTPPPSPNVPPPSSSKPSESPPPPRSQSSSPPSPSPPVRSPPPTISKPPESSPPPPSSKAPESSPSPPSSKAPESSPSPPSSKPPQSSPPPPSSKPPKSSPPPSPSKIPKTSPPTPSSKPPNSSPPPLASLPPQGSSPPSSASITPKSSPTPSASTDPKNSPPPSSSLPPKNAPLPPRHTPPAPPSSHLTPSPGSSPPKSSPTLPLKPPTTPPTARSPPSSSSGNRSSNDSITDVPGTSHSNNNGGIDTRALVAIAVATSIIVIGFLGLAVWWLRHRRKRVPRPGGLVMPSPPGTSQRIDSPAMKAHFSAPLIGNGGCSESASSPKDPGGMGNSRSWFTFDELANATNGFSTQNLLGEGGFGSVYKGHLPDGREVAVKQLKIGGGQGEREFKAEVEIISRIHHRHLVSLVGYCISDNRRLLVYEYVPNKTLYHHLHGEGRPVLDWKTRVKVAVGAARGIAYLHEDCHPRVFHRDIKSSNILLDENFEARVSDFGLAKLALDANSHVSTRVIGTFGYVAPEYASSGKLTEKSDVYSFGVVLLELITGRKPVDASQPLGDESLVEWARPLLSNALDNEEFEGLADPRLEKKYVESEMFRMIEVAAACVRHSAAKRPRMGQVVRAFDSLATSDLSNGMRVGQSEIYDSAQQSAEIRLFRRMAFGSQNYSTDFFSQVS